MAKVSAIDIKKLWYSPCVEAALTPLGLFKMLNNHYMKCTSTTAGKLKVVANDATPGANEIKLQDVVPFIKATPEEATLAVNDYVLLHNATATEIDNIHQDTWQLEEGEASQDSYKNQLTGHVYRLGKRQMGDLTISFTIGQYDYKTKVDMMGGSMLDSNGAATQVAANAIGWARSAEAVEMYKTLVALTTDDVYVILSRASLGAREANTDKAIGMAMSGTMTDPVSAGVASEYWYDKSAVVVS